MYSSSRRSTGRLTPTRKLVKKGSSLRDLRPLTERVVLEKVLGVTVKGNSGLACNPVSGNIAYAAGCVIVIIGSPAQCQSHIVNSSRKTISSLAFSPDGKFLVSGESGHQPAVRVWDAEDGSHPQISEMAKGHKHGIQCVAFSPNLKYVVSVGFQHDMNVNIWNWREGTTIACNKVSSKVLVKCSLSSGHPHILYSVKVSAISFSEKGDYFVTVGVRIVKFWYIDSESATKAKKKIPLLGRPAILGEKRNNQFIDVACGVGGNSKVTYCVTKSGLLCSFNEKRLLDKWVEMRVNGAYSVTVNEQLIFCGCSDGIIRVFNSSSLQFIGSLPKPHCLGVDVAGGLDPSHLLMKKENAAYPDTVAITVDHMNSKLTCVYNDHSIYIWDIKDIKKIGKVSSFLYHNSCVWGVEVYPEISGNYQQSLPFGSFVTCSSDGTVRVWNIETGANVVTQKNIYSKELIQILYTEKDLTCLKDTKGNSETSAKESNIKPGVRCLKLCCEGQQLATGDRMGNIRVFDIAFMDELIKIEAHESEVLCIEFSTPDSGYKLLGSAGRDRLIHVFDCENKYNLIQTIDDHSASITSIKFNVSESKDFQLISCAADKSVIFRSAQKDPELQFTRYTNVATKTTFYDMDIHPSRKYAVTAGHDRNLRVYDISSGKQIRSFKGSMGDDGLILKVLLDRSGFYAATSCSDKSLSLYDFDVGECVAGMVGHSEVVTGLQYTVDCKRLITVSGDGCIFVWKLPSAFSQNMSEKLQGHGSPKEEILPDTPLRRETFTLSKVDGVVNGDFQPATEEIFENGDCSPPQDDDRFSMSKLPPWAKKQIANRENVEVTEVSKTIQTSTTVTGPPQPAGKWAETFNQVNLRILPNASLDDSPEWRRLTTEPGSVNEHIDALARTPLEKRLSDGSHDEEEFFFQDADAVLRSLEKEQRLHKNVEDLASGVKISRGSDVTINTVETRTYVESRLVEDTTELKKETNVNERDEQDIIYYPTEEDLDSEVASLNKQSCKDTISKELDKEANTHDNKNSKPSAGLTPSDQQDKSLSLVNNLEFKPNPNKKVKHSPATNQECRTTFKKRTLEDILRRPSETDEIGYFEMRSGHSMDNLVIHEVEFAPLGRRSSEEQLLGATPYDVKVCEDSEDDKDLESQNTESNSRDETDDKTGDSLSEEEDLFTKEIIPKWDELAEEPAPTVDRAEAENSKEFLMENFECLGSTPTQEKDEPVFESCPEAVPTEPLPFDRNTFHRTSISARFILRSRQSSLRSASNKGALRTTEPADLEKNAELEKRREALESTKRSLEALGFKAIDNWSKTEKGTKDSEKISSVGTETAGVKQENDARNFASEEPPVTSPSINSEESPESHNSTLAKHPSCSTPTHHLSPSGDATHRLSLESAALSKAFLSSQIPSSSYDTTAPHLSLPLTSSTEGSVDPIAQKIKSPPTSPSHSSFKVISSPKGTVVSKLELTNILHDSAEEKPLAPVSERAENEVSNDQSNISGTIFWKDNETDGELSPSRRASELIAFFEPGQKNNQTKQEARAAINSAQKTNSEPRSREDEPKKKKKETREDRLGKVPKYLRPPKLPLSKSNDKNTTHSRRSFPFSITRITKSKGTERKSLASKNDLSKAKSCGDLLQEQKKVEAKDERTRRTSDSQEDKNTASVILKTEGTNLAETSRQDKTKEINDSKLSELSAELTAALATPPPQPIQLNLSRNYRLDVGNLTSPQRQTVAWKEKGFSDKVTKSECSQVVVDLVHAFERALECHSKILQGDVDDDQQQALSILSATFSTIQESVVECKRDREQKSRLSSKSRISDERPSSEEVQNKQTKEASQQTDHNFSHSDNEKIVPLLEKYSELLLEKLNQKLKI